MAGVGAQLVSVLLVDYPGGLISIVPPGDASDLFAGIAFPPDRYGAYGPGAECPRAAAPGTTAFD
jgi:hypothetical protein